MGMHGMTLPVANCVPPPHVPGLGVMLLFHILSVNHLVTLSNKLARRIRVKLWQTSAAYLPRVKVPKVGRYQRYHVYVPRGRFVLLEGIRCKL